MGLLGSRTVQLTFEDMKVPAENLLGEEGQGFKVAMANLDVGRIGIGAQALGIAEAALGCAIDYAKERAIREADCGAARDWLQACRYGNKCRSSKVTRI